MREFEAVLFDCDGVLVDSEMITNEVLHRMLAEAGWEMTREECMGHFVGKMVRSRQNLIEEHTGKPLTDEWMDDFYRQRNRALEVRVEAVPGAREMVRRADMLFDGRIACASGADKAKLRLQLEKVGLYSFFGHDIYSGHEMAANKPAPDVYLAAAAGLGVAPENCLVVEDSVTGTRAGAAAGAFVLAYCPPGHHSTAEELEAAGAARVFPSLQELTQYMESVHKTA